MIKSRKGYYPTNSLSQCLPQLRAYDLVAERWSDPDGSCASAFALQNDPDAHPQPAHSPHSSSAGSVAKWMFLVAGAIAVIIY